MDAGPRVSTSRLEMAERGPVVEMTGVESNNSDYEMRCNVKTQATRRLNGVHKVARVRWIDGHGTTH
jgi:hypothetical protein